MPILRRSAYAMIEHCVASRLIRLVRTAETFADPRAARDEIAEWTTAVSGFPRDRLGILLDWRLVPMNLDPAVTREVVSRTDALARQFGRQALLLATQVGALQSTRLSRVHASAPTVFLDEDEAWAYATFDPRFEAARANKPPRSSR